jgi:predicted transcriptional regulator
MTPDTVTLSPELRAALIELAARTGRPAQELLDAAAKFYAQLPPDAPPGSIPGVDPADVLAALADVDAGRVVPHDEVFARRRARK